MVHELGLIARVLKACQMDWGIALPQGIPTQAIRRPKVNNARERRLEGQEEALLLNALAGKTYRSVRLAQSCANMIEADFLLRRGWFRPRLATLARAHLSTG